MIETAQEAQQKAMSQDELNYALALLELGIPFDMQFILGVMGVRGSQRIDIVAYTAPRSTAIFIEGAGYYHGGAKESEDRLKQAEAEQAGFIVLVVKGADTATVAAAKAHAQRNLL